MTPKRNDAILAFACPLRRPTSCGVPGPAKAAGVQAGPRLLERWRKTRKARLRAGEPMRKVAPDLRRQRQQKSATVRSVRCAAQRACLRTGRVESVCTASQRQPPARLSSDAARLGSCARFPSKRRARLRRRNGGGPVQRALLAVERQRGRQRAFRVRERDGAREPVNGQEPGSRTPSSPRAQSAAVQVPASTRAPGVAGEASTRSGVRGCRWRGRLRGRARTAEGKVVVVRSGGCSSARAALPRKNRHCGRGKAERSPARLRRAGRLAAFGERLCAANMPARVSRAVFSQHVGGCSPRYWGVFTAAVSTGDIGVFTEMLGRHRDIFVHRRYWGVRRDALRARANWRCQRNGCWLGRTRTAPVRPSKRRDRTRTGSTLDTLEADGTCGDVFPQRGEHDGRSQPQPARQRDVRASDGENARCTRRLVCRSPAKNLPSVVLLPPPPSTGALLTSARSGVVRAGRADAAGPRGSRRQAQRSDGQTLARTAPALARNSVTSQIDS